MLTMWLAVALVCPFAGMAQEMARQGDAEHLVPQGWESKQAVGDLDRDGIDDMVVVAQPNDERHLKVRDDGYVYNFNPPSIVARAAGSMSCGTSTKTRFP